MLNAQQRPIKVVDYIFDYSVDKRSVRSCITLPDSYLNKSSSDCPVSEICFKMSLFNSVHSDSEGENSLSFEPERFFSTET